MTNEKFRAMRRQRQLLPKEESVAILERGSNGILALHGDGGYPYAVPLSYAYADGKIYFHSACQGHKVDALGRDARVSFCVVEQDDVKPAEFTTYYRSVIVFGTARILAGEAEKRTALELLAAKYSPGEPGRDAEINKSIGNLLIVAIDIEHMTGKEAIELFRERSRTSAS
ncbi:MAG: NimABCDEF family 5-nitroimidazole reductase [Bacteroidaceae bacterium]|jgi:nitroimidazol reductase NimA-like FMN-containing flavoprotein (pyridoxamine 5'-phosphate oxidase superfamily)